MTSSRVWLITGANTGLGLELALKCLQEGDKVVAAVRTPSRAPDSLRREDVAIIPFDLSWSQERMNEFVKNAVDTFGRIDVVVNNAGYAYMGAVEETVDEDTKAQFDTNVFAMLRLIRSALPYLRAQHSGTIMNLSSIGGFHGFVSNGIYCATKFAVEGFTEALAGEVAPFGINCVIVEPGYFRTNFLANPSAGANLAKAMDVYAGTPAYEARAAFEKYNGKQPGDPKKGAARMWEYVAGEGVFKGKKRLLRLPLGSDTGAQMKKYVEDLKMTVETYDEIWNSTDIVERNRSQARRDTVA